MKTLSVLISLLSSPLAFALAIWLLAMSSPRHRLETHGDCHTFPVLGGSSHLSGLVHPSYKWINPTYAIYHWGELTHLRAVGSSPPSNHSCESQV